MFGMARRLRPLHRELGVADQILGIVDLVAAERDADRACDADFEVGHAERRRERRFDPAGDLVGLRRIVFERQQDTEFVTAGPRQHIDRAQRALQPARDGDQQFVAGHRPHAGVDAG